MAAGIMLHIPTAIFINLCYSRWRITYELRKHLITGRQLTW